MEGKWHPAVAARQGDERLLRTDQAAKKLKCHPSTVRRLCQNQLLPGVKFGPRKWLIPESSLLDYLSIINHE